VKDRVSETPPPEVSETAADSGVKSDVHDRALDAARPIGLGSPDETGLTTDDEIPPDPEWLVELPAKSLLPGEVPAKSTTPSSPYAAAWKKRLAANPASMPNPSVASPPPDASEAVYIPGVGYVTPVEVPDEPEPPRGDPFEDWLDRNEITG